MTLLDIFRRSFPAAAKPPAGGRQLALNTPTGAPYDAAAAFSQDMGEWFPALWSPDIEINPWRDRMVARLRDLVRNDGWASGAITSLVDAAIGANFSPVPDPNLQVLRLYSTTFDDVWAEEFSDGAEALWSIWSNDPGRLSDAGRRQTLGQIQRTAFRHYCVDGGGLAQLAWDPRRIKVSGFATCVQLIDPDRLSNPQPVFDLHYLRGGVEIDDFGAARAYHVRRAQMGDWFAGPDQVI
jgi:capsid protein